MPTDLAAAAFEFEPSPAPVDAAARVERLRDPGFGRVFTDHMASIRWSEGRGWHNARIVARTPLTLDPSTAVLHYAQEIFEGLKAYRLPDDRFALFRADANARRFQSSARRMAMPELPEASFVESCRALVRADRDWMPDIEGGSIYLRPFMIADEVFLGVKPSANYHYMVIASAAGNYWKGPPRAVSLWVAREHSRAAAGGTGAAKCGGNYAASLMAQGEAIRRGCDQVVFLDAAERRWVEELGGMNIFFVFADGTLATPPLTGTILPGITRDSLIALARDMGLTVAEQPYAIEQWHADAASGRLAEAFACGTAAVVTPIGEVADGEAHFTIGGGGPGPVTTRLRDALVAIQRGTAPGPAGWVQPIS